MIEILENKYVSSVLTLIVVLYATFLRPELPQNMKDTIKDLFNNTIFRIFVLFLVVAFGNTRPSLALIIAIAFVLTMDQIYVWDSKEAFESISYENFVAEAVNGSDSKAPINIYINRDGLQTPKPAAESSEVSSDMKPAAAMKPAAVAKKPNNSKSTETETESDSKKPSRKSSLKSSETESESGLAEIRKKFANNNNK